MRCAPKHTTHAQLTSTELHPLHCNTPSWANTVHVSGQPRTLQTRAQDTAGSCSFSVVVIKHTQEVIGVRVMLWLLRNPSLRKTPRACPPRPRLPLMQCVHSSERCRFSRCYALPTFVRSKSMFPGCCMSSQPTAQQHLACNTDAAPALLSACTAAFHQTTPNPPTKSTAHSAGLRCKANQTTAPDPRPPNTSMEPNSSSQA